MSRIKSAVIIAGLLAIAIAVTGCEVIGYNTPVVGSTSASWQSFESIDEDTGDKLISIKTHTQSNSFFGKLLSVFGRPSLTISCVISDKQPRASIDWREAIGPPQMNRIVYSRLDGGTVKNLTWKTSLSGRKTHRTVSLTGPIGILDDTNVIAFRTVNSGGNNVSLLFNVSGIENVYNAIETACAN